MSTIKKVVLFMQKVFGINTFKKINSLIIYLYMDHLILPREVIQKILRHNFIYSQILINL